MAHIFLKYDFSGVTQDVIITWVEFTAPTAEIDRFVVDDTTGHEKVGQTTLPNLNPVMHRVRFYQSSDGVTLETLLFSMDLDASLSDVPSVELFSFLVGSGEDVGDGVHIAPVGGDTQYLNDLLANTDIQSYEVVQRGFGPLVWGEEITALPGGGFEWVSNAFNEGDRFFITAHLITQQSSSGVTTASPFTGVEIITGNIDFNGTYYNKLIVAQNVSSAIIGVADFADIPNDTVLHLTTHGAQKFVTIDFAADTVFFQGLERSQLHIGRGELIKIYWKNGIGHVIDYDGDYKRAGEYGQANKLVLNSVYADGTEYDILDVPRLHEALTTDQIVSYADFDLFIDKVIDGNTYRYYYNRGKVAVNEPGGKLKVPDLRNYSMRMLKSVDGTVNSEMLSQGAGGIWSKQNLVHRHDVPAKNLTGATDINTVSVYDTRSNVAVPPVKTAPAGGSDMRVDSIGQYGIVYI